MNLGSAGEKIFDAQKASIAAVAEVAEKKIERVEEEQIFQSSSFRKLSAEPKAAALMEHKPIRCQILAPNEPHPCDKYGCQRDDLQQLDDLADGGEIIV